MKLLISSILLLIPLTSVSLAAQLDAREAAPAATSAAAGDSASAESPSALYKTGVELRGKGEYEDAAAYFYAAARKGYHVAEVELAFLHTEEGSPVRDDPVGYAWFALALKHETNESLKATLKSNLLKVRARMSDTEKTRAKRLRIALDKNLGDIQQIE